MRRRCKDAGHKDYKWYGGKGITVDPRWENFQHFCDDMLTNYFIGATIERRDREQSYYKANCCWVTMSEQQKNRSNVLHLGKGELIRKLYAEGQTQQEIAKELTMSQSSVSRYIRGVLS